LLILNSDKSISDTLLRLSRNLWMSPPEFRLVAGFPVPGFPRLTIRAYALKVIDIEHMLLFDLDVRFS